MTDTQHRVANPLEFPPQSLLWLGLPTGQKGVCALPEGKVSAERPRLSTLSSSSQGEDSTECTL